MYSRKARRNSSGKGIGTSSAMALVHSLHIREREGGIEPRGLDEGADRHPLDPAVRHVFLTRAEANRGYSHDSHRADSIGAEDPLIHDRWLPIERLVSS